MSAVAALPYLYLTLCEDLCHFHIVKQRAVALLMMLFNSSYQTEFRGQLRESLFLGSLCETFVHIRPLIVLAFSGMKQVLSGISDALHFLKPHLCVLFLIVSRLQKQSRDLLISFLLCYGREICILVARLRFSGESGLQVLFCLCSSVFAHLLFFLSFSFFFLFFFCLCRLIAWDQLQQFLCSLCREFHCRRIF